ncbi:hypothetical protein L6164_009998 [Bauhinia variegata]|uniref:Uncharacterized protein n=1 Tax=Bauhinia variegata TaxID=167791 RepID=A0ACB9PLR1_BAUVA|nr:hypothetical protein L6164_009998 [Bauhinia variegata]
MSSSESSSIPFRSKMPHHTASKSKSPDSVQLSSKTPEKPPQFSNRSRNRGVAHSIKEIRKVAQTLQERNREQHHDPTAHIKSARRQITMLSPRKSNVLVEEPTKLPEKYEILAEFFDSLDSSIRLLRLKGSIPTFTNICPKIQCLTDRRFTHGHLAQLKFILREAIVIKMVLMLDERTSCMKPDLHVTLNNDAIESDAKLLSESGSMSLRKFVRKWLRDFLKTHPEGGEIPEEMLPEPFNRPKQDHSDSLKISSSSFPTEASSGVCVARPSSLSACLQDDETSDKEELGYDNLKNQDLTSSINSGENLSMPVKMSIEALNQPPAVATHLSQFFKRRFSQKSVRNEADSSQQKLPSDSSQPPPFPVSESSPKKSTSCKETRSPPNSSSSKLALEAVSNERSPTVCASPSRFTSSGGPAATPSKTTKYLENEDGSLQNIATMSTPAKLAFTPSRLMTVTPSLPPPKRCYMSPDDNTSSSPNKLVRRPPRSRSLKFDSPVKNEETDSGFNDAGSLSIDKDIFDILPENLLQSIREKERIAMEERNPAISRAKRRQQMIVSLPKLFNMIHMLFHSINRSVITKEELVSKIISSHSYIVDRREVEEQLNLLLELVPEWISEKKASSGDLLFRINKMLNAETMRSMLEQAK